jgi:hypothetical protein
MVACAGPPVLHAAADDCMAACSRPSPDGQSCAQWSAFVRDSCVARHSAAASCCAAGDHAMCPTTAPLVMGSPCVCRAADARGAYVVQGYARTTP